MGNFKNNQRKLKQEDKNDNFKDVWDGSEKFSISSKMPFFNQYRRCFCKIHAYIIIEQFKERRIP